MKLYDQMREVIADLKALKDVSLYADSIQADVLIPFSTIVIQQLSNIHSAVSKVSTRLLPPEHQKEFDDALRSSMVSASQGLEEALNNARVSIVEIYSE